jgi:hypothetical protein
MDIQILNYQPQYKDDFKRLNMEWISPYFEMENLDIQQLINPEEYTIFMQGNFFFLLN